MSVPKFQILPAITFRQVLNCQVRPNMAHDRSGVPLYITPSCSRTLQRPQLQLTCICARLVQTGVSGLGPLQLLGSLWTLTSLCGILA
jgi:hypothetical protein